MRDPARDPAPQDALAAPPAGADGDGPDAAGRRGSGSAAAAAARRHGSFGRRGQAEVWSLESSLSLSAILSLSL